MACLICVAGATFANAQTTRTATPVEKKSTVQIKAEQAGVNRSQPAPGPSTEVRCRGGQDKLIFTTENARLGSTGETIDITLLTFEPSPHPGGARGEGLHPGEMDWRVRPGHTDTAAFIILHR